MIRCFRRFYATRPQYPFSAGQPVHETRPFLLKPGELTIGIPAIEYYERRLKLAERLPANSVAIAIGEQVKYASGSVFYDFQQNNDLYYLSGWNEPDSVIAIEKPNDNLDDVIFHMIVPPKDIHAEQWEGARSGVEGAVGIFNADLAEQTTKLGSYLSNLIKSNSNIYIDLPSTDKSSTTPSSVFGNFFSLGNDKNTNTIQNLLTNYGTGKKIRSLSSVVKDLRVIKSENEIAVMRKAGQISGRAYNQAFAKKFKTERTLKSFLEYKFISGGCTKSAYIPVVAGGPNALCIHYTRNDDNFYDNEMVLVDASGNLGGYCSDISRTWPVNGKFSPAQAELYQAVLNVQKQCIELCTENQVYSLQDIHNKSCSFMTEELRNCGFMGLKSYEVTKLYTHYIGHNLGLDVHDLPNYSRSAALRAGQVVTIEPGVYVPDDTSYPKGFRNIGIRIEDDIAVGKDTFTNLTVEAAKEILDIERIAEIGVTTPNVDDEVDSIV